MNPTIDNAIQDAIQDLESELDAIIAGVNNPSAPAPLPTISDEEAERIMAEKDMAMEAEIRREIEAEIAADEPAAIPETVTLQTFGPGADEPVRYISDETMKATVDAVLTAVLTEGAQEAAEPSPVSDSPEAAEASPAPAVADDEPETYGTYSATIGADVRCYLEINGISARTPEEARKLAYESAVNGNAERQGWKPSELQGEISISVGDEETDGAEFDEFESMPDPDGTPRYQTLESFVRQIAGMTSLRDIFESMPEEKRIKDQVKSPDNVEVTIEEAYIYTWAFHGLIDEARKLFPNAAANTPCDRILEPSVALLRARLEIAESLLLDNCEAWDDEEDSVKKEHAELIALNEAYFARKAEREAGMIAQAVIEETPERKPASLGAAAAPVEPEPAADLKPYSVIVAWNRNDSGEGFYNWAGLAADGDDAADRARRESCEEHGWEPEEDEDGDLNGPTGEIVFEMEGVDVWTAPDLLASLKEMTDWMGGDTKELSPRAHEILARARAVIAKAECRE
jgi:hypothetical protein